MMMMMMMMMLMVMMMQIGDKKKTEQIQIGTKHVRYVYVIKCGFSIIEYNVMPSIHIDGCQLDNWLPVIGLPYENVLFLSGFFLFIMEQNTTLFSLILFLFILFFAHICLRSVCSNNIDVVIIIISINS